MSAFDRLLAELMRRGVRFVVIGVWGAEEALRELLRKDG
jgi:hypothetical protein